MPTKDSLVTARMVLEELMQLRHQGVDPMLQRLEQVEPELANYAFEALSQLNATIGSLGGTARQQRRAFRMAQEIVLICIAALQRGQRELWEGEQGQQDHPDPAESPDSPGSPDPA